MNVPETFFTVNEHLILFGLSCICGIALGIVYDIFRTVRTVFPHGFWTVALEDIIFLVFWGLLLSAFTSVMARGEFRFFYVFGNILGFILYIVTAGNAVIGIIRRLTSAVKRIIAFILSPLGKLYVFLRRKYGMKFVGSSKVFVNSLKNVKILLLKGGKVLYNDKESINRKDVDCVGKKSKNKEKEPLQQRSR